MALAAIVLALACPAHARAADPTLAAVGDIACTPGDTTHPCRQAATAGLVASQAPTAVAVLGDNQYQSGTYAEFMGAGAYDSTWGQFNPIVHPIPGNHEYGTTAAAGYFQYFGAAADPPAAGPNGSYSYDLGAWHIVALNSDCADPPTGSAPSAGCSNSVQGTTSGPEVSWLQSDLQAHANQCILAYWHHPLFSSGWVGNSPSVVPFWDALYAAHADVVLNGHDHMYERFAPQDPAQHPTADGIREFVVGTGGENLFTTGTTQSNMDDLDNQHYGALFLTLHATSYDWKFIATDGATLDSGSTACHNTTSTAPTTTTSTTSTTSTTTTATTTSTTTTTTTSTSTTSTPTTTAVSSPPPTNSSSPAPAPVWVAPAQVPVPRFVFGIRVGRTDLHRIGRTGLPVRFHCSAACDVRVTIQLLRGRHLVLIGRSVETEEQIPSPWSTVRLHARWRMLAHRRAPHLKLSFVANGAGFQRRVLVTWTTLGLPPRRADRRGLISRNRSRSTGYRRLRAPMASSSW